MRHLKHLLAAGLLAASPVAHAVLFFDDFQSGSLANWVLKGGGAPVEAAVVVDPLSPVSNKALTFNALNSGGSILSSMVFPGSGTYTISFDYLGKEFPGFSIGDNFGGFLGIGALSGDVCPSGGCWLAGTAAGYVGTFGTVTHLVDDGAWHSYSITFTPPAALSGGFRIMLEDFSGSGGVAGDAYFDNISLVPEPSTYAMLIAGLGLLGFIARRRMARG